MMFIGMVAAPMLLLRSEQSVASPNEFRQLEADDKKEFMDDAKGIDRIRTSMIAAIILWGYATVLGLAHHLYPVETARLVWAWLLAIL
jgi:hypothetical protein